MSVLIAVLLYGKILSIEEPFQAQKLCNGLHKKEIHSIKLADGKVVGSSLASGYYDDLEIFRG